MAGIAGAMATTVRISTAATCSSNRARAHITQLRDLRLHGDATALQINQRIGHMQPPRNLAYHYARFMAAKKANSRIVTFRSRTLAAYGS